jgi:hypothetical protein
MPARETAMMIDMNTRPISPRVMLYVDPVWWAGSTPLVPMDISGCLLALLAGEDLLF